MYTIFEIYRDYIRENKIWVIISLLLSLRLEIISSFITFFVFAIIEKELSSNISKLIGYLIISSILPTILSIVNLKKIVPYIQEHCLEEYVKIYKIIIFLMNFAAFSLTVTLAVTIAGEKLALLIPFDIVRMTLLRLGNP